MQSSRGSAFWTSRCLITLVRSNAQSFQHEICCNIAFPLQEAYGFTEDRASTNFIQADALDEDAKRYIPFLNFYSKDIVVSLRAIQSAADSIIHSDSPQLFFPVQNF